MLGPADKAIIPTKHVINGRVMGGTMRRKNGVRTMPVPSVAAAAKGAAAALPPPAEDEDLPAAKKPRLQASSSNSTAADGVTIDSPSDTPTDPVTPAAPLPASHAPRRNWKEEEDTKLIEAVKKYGKKWVKVATLVPGRSNHQCQKRWADTLDPTSGKSAGKWTPEEDAKLTEAVQKLGKESWVAVAALVPGRTNVQCSGRWTIRLNPSIGKSAGKWTPEEDAKLTEAVKKDGNRWVKVAALVHGRTDKKCRERWVMILDPDRASNTVEEDPERRQSRSA
jgi:hypothetical protein